MVNSEGPYDLIIDTGSSNTWIGASKSYTPSLTEITGLFEVSYGSGMVIGYEVNTFCSVHFKV
jgi:cathepsin E